MTEDNGLTGIAHAARDAFDKGASTAQGIHETIALTPFDLMERLGVMPELAAEGKRVTSTTLATIYDKVRDVNHRVSDYAVSLTR